MKRNQMRPWLKVITGGESLISMAGGVLLTDAARACGLDRASSAGLRAWRLP